MCVCVSRCVCVSMCVCVCAAMLMCLTSYPNFSPPSHQVQAYSLRVASLFRGKVSKGDAVALLMENRVEYIAIWLGLSRVGCGGRYMGGMLSKQE